MFYTKYRYNWEITDLYGYSLNQDHIREYNLYTVLDDINNIDELNSKL